MSRLYFSKIFNLIKQCLMFLKEMYNNLHLINISREIKKENLY